MKYVDSRGWGVLLIDAGVMHRAQLIDAGVPAPIAKELFDQSKTRDKSPNQDWRKENPDAC